MGNATEIDGITAESHPNVFELMQLNQALHDLGLARLDVGNALASIRRAESLREFIPPPIMAQLTVLKEQTTALLQSFNAALTENADGGT